MKEKVPSSIIAQRVGRKVRPVRFQNSIQENKMSSQFLSRTLIAEQVPSVFATDHDGHRSDRYTFVSSSKIIDLMEEVGWGVVNVMAPKCRTSDPNHCMHTIRFRSQDESLSWEDPRLDKRTFGDFTAQLFPELVLQNSSNGTFRFKMKGGVFAMICSNGMIISWADFCAFESKHIDFDAEEAYSVVSTFTEMIPNIVERVDQWSHIEIEPADQISFARFAISERWDKHSEIDPDLILKPQREEDVGDDLWRVFNRIQENVMNGGFKGPKRKVRPLTQVRAVNDVNTALWYEGERIYERYTGAVIEPFSVDFEGSI